MPTLPQVFASYRILVLIAAHIKNGFNCQASSEKALIKFLRSCSKYESKRFLGHKQGTIKKGLVKNKKRCLLNSTGKVMISFVKQMNPQTSYHLTEF